MNRVPSQTVCITATTWLIRALTLVTIGGFNVAGLLSANRILPPWALVIFFPIVIPAVFLVLNAGVFPLKYTVFGRLCRTKMPQVEPLAKALMSGGSVGWTRGTMPFFSWYLFADGLGFTFNPKQPGFVPFEYVRNIERGFFGAITITHDWSEVRSPIVIPQSSVAARLESAYQSYRQSSGETR